MEGGAGFWGAGIIMSPPNPWIWMAEVFWLALDLICVGSRDDSYTEDDPLAGALWSN